MKKIGEKIQRDFLIQDLNSFGHKWGVLHKTLLKSKRDSPKWTVDLEAGIGLKEAIQNLYSKSVPIEEIFLNKKLHGKPYLVYFKWVMTKYGLEEKGCNVAGIIQVMDSPSDDSMDYYYIVSHDTNYFTIGDYERRIKTSYNKFLHSGGIKSVERLLSGKIWANCHALDINYLLNNNEYQFMNWNKDNPLEVKE